MKKDSGRPTRSLRDVVIIAMDDLGSHATISDTTEAVRDTATAREWATWCERYIVSGIRGALRAKTGDLPDFYAVDGAYKALRLFTVEDYESKARSMARLSGANAGKVYALRDACEEAHGRSFDADAIIAAERAA